MVNTGQYPLHLNLITFSHHHHTFSYCKILCLIGFQALSLPINQVGQIRAFDDVSLKLFITLTLVSHKHSRSDQPKLLNTSVKLK